MDGDGDRIAGERPPRCLPSELMDPTFITQPCVPMTAFPASVIIHCCGRIRWRPYGSETGLNSIRAAIDEVLAAPRYPTVRPASDRCGPDGADVSRATSALPGSAVRGPAAQACARAG